MQLACRTQDELRDSRKEIMDLPREIKENLKKANVSTHRTAHKAQPYVLS